MKAVFFRCYLLLLFVPGSWASAAGWFEGVNDAHYPWLYHVDHGWMYATDSNGGGAWMWDTGLGWVWTNEAAYPFVYEPLAGWVKYEPSTHNPRQFLDISTAHWLVDESIENQNSYFPVPTEWETFTWFYIVNNGQPVDGTIDGITMRLNFWEYKVTFSGSDLKRKVNLQAGISGVANIEGEWFTLGGNLRLMTEERLERSALGLFEREADFSLYMRLFLDGQPVTINGYSTAYDFGELLMAFPWQRDLYEEPLHSTFYQVIPSGRVSGSVKFEVDGYPEETVEDYFNFNFDPLPTLHMEIVAKHDHYFLSTGQPFQRVVEVVVTQTVPDPTTGIVEQSQGRIWLAPGIGPIRFIEDNPVTGTPIVVEYSHSFM
ncbi:hypothetical protein G0Q06_12835 [Puniceicoccales bacterium CK1056]|uniref:Uncharacterized protein n=1 Tax=Oceanipulchritudo coccoides TaxID=2706888 RepID=A0A6B2M5E8_9BACT|nr:hypothetical protein [Oceanipulchritudo coccoides]NDV63344.1 hypothetical protein [Oceanipulchritudo coccoides]